MFWMEKPTGPFLQKIIVGESVMEAGVRRCYFVRMNKLTLWRTGGDNARGRCHANENELSLRRAISIMVLDSRGCRGHNIKIEKYPSSWMEIAGEWRKGSQSRYCAMGSFLAAR